MKLPKLQLEKIKEFSVKLPRFLGKHAFFTFLGLFLLSLIFGGLIFYRYSILAERKPLDISDEVLKFKEKTYQRVLEIWQEKEKKFKEADVKKYPNPFQEKSEEVSESVPEKEEKPQEEISPEIPTDITQKLLLATNLIEFYGIKGEILPPLYKRAGLWQEKGLGPAGEYIGSKYQNLKLLEELKKELTE